MIMSMSSSYYHYQKITSTFERHLFEPWQSKPRTSLLHHSCGFTSQGQMHSSTYQEERVQSRLQLYGGRVLLCSLVIVNYQYSDIYTNVQDTLLCYFGIFLWYVIQNKIWMGVLSTVIVPLAVGSKNSHRVRNQLS